MQLNQASVLIVDDEAVLREIFGAWFRRVAGQVFLAGDGVEALQILAAHKIDLVITDVRMPEMDGISLLSRIRLGGPHAPAVVLVSGSVDIKARDAYDLGADAILNKPTERSHLIDVAQTSLLAPDELWRTPGGADARTRLSACFDSLAAALREHRIAFGRRGFCIATRQLEEEARPVNIELHFKADEWTLSGQGIVRWLSHQDGQAGIELTYVDGDARQRVLQLAQQSSCFIPRSTEPKYATQNRS